MEGKYHSKAERIARSGHDPRCRYPVGTCSTTPASKTIPSNVRCDIGSPNSPWSSIRCNTASHTNSRIKTHLPTLANREMERALVCRYDFAGGAVTHHNTHGPHNGRMPCLQHAPQLIRTTRPILHRCGYAWGMGRRGQPSRYGG